MDFGHRKQIAPTRRVVNSNSIATRPSARGRCAGICIVVALGASFALTGCAGDAALSGGVRSQPLPDYEGGSPYMAVAPGGRDPARAQSLTRDAAALIASDPVRAESLLREALAADLWHGPAHNNLGVLLLGQKRLYEAANEFEWARKLMPGHPDPRMNLALTLERAGRVDDAIAGYESALEVWPGHIQTVQAIARLQVRERREDDRLGAWLGEIALRGETEQWREWARSEASRREQ